MGKEIKQSMNIKKPPLFLFPLVILSCFIGSLWMWCKLTVMTFIKIPYIVYKILDGIYNSDNK